MKPSTQDKIEGTLHVVKGKAKEAAGRVANSPGLADKGHAEGVAGTVQKKVGQVEKALGK